MSNNGDAKADAPVHMRWLILAACVIARSGIGLQFIAIAALMPLIRADLNLDYTEIGLLLGLFMVMGIFLSVPSGMIASRWGDRRTLFIGLGALIVAGWVTAFADGFNAMLAGRVLGGVGAVLITVTAAKILTDWFHGREMTTAMGCLGLSWPIGIALGLSILPTIADGFDWRVAVQATVAIPAIAVVVAVLVPRLGRPITSKVEVLSMTLWSISRPELWVILAGGAAWPLMSSGGYVVFSSFASELIVGRGLTHAQAGLALGVLSWLFIVTIPLGGWIADRWGGGDRLIWLGCLLSAVTISLVPLGGPVLVWVGLTAVMGLTVGPLMALPGQVLSPGGRAMGMGVYYSIYYLGTVLLPALAGWLLDATGSPAWVVWFAAGCLVVAPLFILWARFLQRRWALGR